MGPGLAARRIFADLGSGATSQIKLVEQAHAAGMLPVISYKVGGDVSGAVAGRFNAVAAQAAAKLASYDKPTAVTFWHEPHGDMTPAQYVAASKQILPDLQAGQAPGRSDPERVAARQPAVATFASYCPDEMFGLWDWFGIDTYESGTMESPGSRKPADRIPALSSYLRPAASTCPWASASTTATAPSPSRTPARPC